MVLLHTYLNKVILECKIGRELRQNFFTKLTEKLTPLRTNIDVTHTLHFETNSKIFKNSKNESNLCEKDHKKNQISTSKLFPTLFD